MAITEVIKSGEVPAGQELVQAFAPPAGPAKIVFFRGSAVFSPNSVVKIVWKYDDPGEEILWSTKGEVEIHQVFDLGTVNGTDEAAIILDNGESAIVVMSGMGLIEHVE